MTTCLKILENLEMSGILTPVREMYEVWEALGKNLVMEKWPKN